MTDVQMPLEPVGPPNEQPPPNGNVFVPPNGEAEEELEAERERRRSRAARFGTEYVEPGLRHELKPLTGQPAGPPAFREVPKRPGFVTGMDLFDEEEVQRRRQRAQRFGTEEQLLETRYLPLEMPEDETRRMERAARFGTTYRPTDTTGMSENDLLEQRHDVPLDLVRRPNVIHLYGVDIMGTPDCMEYFGDYGPTHVEWIDDSSCNIVFNDAATVQRAIVALGRPLPTELFPDSAGLDPADITNLPFLWHKGEDFVKKDTHVPLLFRMATEADVRPPRGKRFSRYLWKMPIKEAQKQITKMERPMEVDSGDPRVGGREKTRGGKKRTARKRRRALGLGEVEMEDAEEYEYEADVEETDAEKEPKLARTDVPDLRALLGGKAKERLFSAEEAGVLPAFLLGGGDSDAAEKSGAESAPADEAVPEEEEAGEQGEEMQLL